MHHIPQEIKQQGCEELLHLGPKKRLCRELGISQGAIHARSIFVEQGFFDWVKEPAVKQRNETLVDTRTACCRKKATRNLAATVACGNLGGQAMMPERAKSVKRIVTDQTFPALRR